MPSHRCTGRVISVAGRKDILTKLVYTGRNCTIAHKTYAVLR
jgi:hypothetical protein